MKWYANLKISLKLILGFVIIALLFGSVGVYAIKNMKNISDSQVELYRDITVPLQVVGDISTEFQKMRVNNRELIIKENIEDINKSSDAVRGNLDRLNELGVTFEKSIKDDTMREQYGNYQAAMVIVREEIDKIIAAAELNLDDQAFALAAPESRAGKAVAAEQEAINYMLSAMVEKAALTAKTSENEAESAIKLVIVMIVIVVILSILFGLFISSTITKPCRRVVYILKEMTDGHFAERVDINRKDEIGEMSRTMDLFADELRIKVIGVMNKISEGDVSINVVPKDDKDELAPAMKRTIETIRAMKDDTDKLIVSVTQGKLDVRGNADRYSGAWKELLSEINGLVDALVAPINLTAEYIDRISKGDIPDKITDDYQGDFNEIKNNINGCINVMNGLLTETSKLIIAAKAGKLDIRADESNFTGDWGKLIAGVNDILESVVEPIKEVTAVMNQISQGILGVSVVGQYNGEFEVLATSVNATARDLNTVVNEISRVIGQISQGNLALDEVRSYRGDFVTISGSLNTIIDSLNNVLCEINNSSDSVFIGSKQVSDGSQALSQGTTEQASAVEQLNSSVNDVASRTKENATSANEASNLAQSVKENAEQGNGHMQEMLKAMTDLSDASANISRVIKVIDDIAFQTNILALNAAVEAARAGQHGKGFAVVAEEVRTLAGRSADAAKETTELIQSCMKKAAVGTEVANNTAKALGEIVEGIGRTSDIIVEIAKSSNEQAMGISQINVGLGQVAQVIQNNAATAEQSAASSEELTGQAELLKQMIGRFRLRKGNRQLRGSEMKMIGEEPDNYQNNPPEVNIPKIILSSDDLDKY